MKTLIAIFGIKGRLGSSIANLSKQNSDFELLVGIEKRSQLPDEKLLSKAKIWIFVATSGLSDTLKLAVKLQRPLVIGSTGLSKSDLSLMKKVSQDLPIFYASNFSKGIHLMHQAAQITSCLEGGIDLIETHHIHKKDRPSGTAFSLVETLKKPVEVHSIREGSILGEHSLSITGNKEKLTLSHEALSRDLFAQGALDATRFLEEKPAGLYSMKDLFAEEAYLGLGGNLGDPKKTLSKAIEMISALDKVKVLKISPFYQTSPVGEVAQNDFINGAMSLLTTLSPFELQYFLQRIETELGKEIKERNGPRHIDIDILFFGRKRMNHPYLTLPHPRLSERLFVLKPLSDITKELPLGPPFSLKECLASFTNPHQETVTRIAP